MCECPSTPHACLTNLCPTHCSRTNSILPEPRSITLHKCTLLLYYTAKLCNSHVIVLIVRYCEFFRVHCAHYEPVHPYRTQIRVSGTAVSRAGVSQARVGCAEHSLRSIITVRGAGYTGCNSNSINSNVP